MKLGRRFADHRDRDVAEARVLGEHREEGFHHARRKAVAHHDAVDVARVEMLGRGLHAERADHLDAFAHGDAERRIERTAAGDQHGRVVERVAHRQRRQGAALRGEQQDAAQHGGMERAHAHRRLQARDQPFFRQTGVDRQRDRHGGFVVAMRERDRRYDRAVHGGDLQAKHARGGRARRRAGLGDHHGGRLHRDEGSRRVGPFGLDDGEGASGAKRFNQVGRRLFGDDDHRTLKRHEGRTRLQFTCA